MFYVKTVNLVTLSVTLSTIVYNIYLVNSDFGEFTSSGAETLLKIARMTTV